MKYDDVIKYQIGDTFDIRQCWSNQKFDTIIVNKIDESDTRYPLYVLSNKLGAVWLDLDRYELFIAPEPEPVKYIDPNVFHIWTLDLGWRGSHVVVAKTKEQAIEKIRDKYITDDDLRGIEHHFIDENFHFEGVGDN